MKVLIILLALSFASFVIAQQDEDYSEQNLTESNNADHAVAEATTAVYVSLENECHEMSRQLSKNLRK